MIEHGTELIVDRLEVHRRIGHTGFIRRFHDGILPMENIHWLYIPHTFVAEVWQDLFLNDTALCHPCVLSDAVL